MRNCRTVPVLAGLIGLAVSGATYCEAAPEQDIAGRLDICALGDARKPVDLFPDYPDKKYDNRVLDLPGQSIFSDQPAKFRCGGFGFVDGRDTGMYSTDNVIAVTTPDERAIRMVLVTMGTAEQMQAFTAYIEKALGEGRVLRSTVKVKGDRKAGEEIRLIEAPDRNYYLDSVYIGIPVPIGAVTVIGKADLQANKAVSEPKPGR